jgi:hypothetical protein
MKILLKILNVAVFIALAWLYLPLYMLLNTSVALVDGKISYRSLPYVFLPLLFMFGVFYLFPSVKKKYDSNQRIKIHLLIIGILIIPLIFLSIKSSPKGNDIYQPEKDNEEIHSEFKKLTKIKLNCSFTNIPLSDFKSNTLNYADVMESAWTNNIKVRKIINKLDSFDKIPEFTDNYDENMKKICFLQVISKLYSRYGMLKIKQNDFKTAANSLLTINSFFLKSFPYSACFMRLALCVVDNRAIKTMDFLTENTNCPSEVIAVIQESIFEIKPDIRRWVNSEKISYKIYLDKHILAINNIYSSPMNFPLKVSTYLLTDKNKCYKDEEKALNIFFSCVTNHPNDFSVYNKYMEKYKSNIPVKNVFGWMTINTYNSQLPEIYEAITKQIKKRNEIVKKIKNR